MRIEAERLLKQAERDLENPVLKAVREYFEGTEQADVVAVYVFGSQASGRAHRESDVDVAVLFDYAATGSRAARGARMIELNAALVGATHNNRVDVVVLNDVGPELGCSIVHDGTRVFCRDSEADHAFRRNVQLRYADLRPFLERTRRIKLRAILK